MLIVADARRIPLVDGCVQTCVTSPPYWGLRDYGHAGQIGLEATPEAYVATIVSVAREVWRVLRDDGTLWLNLGDSYTASGRGGDTGTSGLQGSMTRQDQSKYAGQRVGHRSSFRRDRRIREDVPHKAAPGLKVKDLIGIPWRVAFALQADGWFLRADIIWSKGNGMPESVTDRPTRSHEYLFLLSKRARYYYDAEAIKETGNVPAGTRAAKGSNVRSELKDVNGRPPEYWDYTGTRNKRSVWTVPTIPYNGAHFATFPPKLIEPCILAGCPLGGLVFDPFIGTGTVGAVAERFGRRWVGTDLSYQPLAQARTAQRGIRWDTDEVTA